MTNPNPQIPQIPGCEWLGHGINPFGDFKEQDFAGVVCDTNGKEVEFDVNGKTYGRPKSVGFLSRTRSEETVEAFTSREEYQSSLKQKLDLEVSYGAFTGGFELTFGSDYKSLSERSAALVNYSSTLWQLILNDKTPSSAFQAAVAKLPSTFNGETAFYDFFRDYGAFVIVNVTLGGSMDYAMLIDRSESTSKETLKAKARAEYDVFFKGSASSSKIEEVKKFREHRVSKLTIKGGKPGAITKLDLDSPDDAAKRTLSLDSFETWKSTIADTPDVVTMKLMRIDAFAGEKGPAIAAALDKYLGGAALVEANWMGSTIVMSGVLRNAAAASAPALRAVIVDKRTLEQKEQRFQAPDAGQSSAQFDEFWKNVNTALAAANPSDKMLLFATERWPRDARYFPPQDVRETLYRHGAREASLNRWDTLTRNAQSCPLAGMSYVLAGDAGRNKGLDAFSAGFGIPDKNTLTPRARVSVLLPREPRTGKIRLLHDDKPVEESNSDLYVIRNHNGSQPVLAADAAGSARLLLKADDATKPEQYWYFYSMGERYGMRPYVLINYLTCGVLAGKRGGGESDLQRFNFNFQDDVLWDYRGDDEKANMLMLHYHMESWNLTNAGGQAAVRVWYQDGMHWRRTRRAI